MNCKNNTCNYFNYCFKRRNDTDFVSPCEKEKRNQDMKSRSDTKLDLVEALFYASIIIVLSVVGLISSVR